MNSKEEQLPFLTDDNPEQTLENCRRFLDLFMYLDRAEPMNDYASAAVSMMLSEISNSLTELGNTYDFVKKAAGGAI